MKVVIRPFYVVKTPGKDSPDAFYHWTSGNDEIDLALDNDFENDNFGLIGLFDHFGSKYVFVPKTYKYDKTNDLISLELMQRDGSLMTKENANEIEKMVIESSLKPLTFKKYSHRVLSKECPKDKPCSLIGMNITDHLMSVTRCPKSFDDPNCTTENYEIKFEFVNAK